MKNTEQIKRWHKSLNFMQVSVANDKESKLAIC